MADADKLLSRMNITIVSVALADPKMLADVLTRCARYHDEAKQITITVNEQDRDARWQRKLPLEPAGLRGRPAEPFDAVRAGE